MPSKKQIKITPPEAILEESAASSHHDSDGMGVPTTLLRKCTLRDPDQTPVDDAFSVEQDILPLNRADVLQ